MTKHKRGERGSSSSSPESPLELKKAKTTETMAEQDFEDKAIRDLIRHLNENMDNNQAKLHEELSYLRVEMKVELDELNGKFKQTSVENVWATIDDMKEESAALKAVKKPSGEGNTEFATRTYKRQQRSCQDQGGIERREGEDH